MRKSALALGALGLALSIGQAEAFPIGGTIAGECSVNENGLGNTSLDLGNTAIGNAQSVGHFGFGCNGALGFDITLKSLNGSQMKAGTFAVVYRVTFAEPELGNGSTATTVPDCDAFQANVLLLQANTPVIVCNDTLPTSGMAMHNDASRRTLRHDRQRGACGRHLR